MSNSPLVNYTKISPNRTSPRNHAIDTITIHCVVGQVSVESLGNVFAPTSRKASCNYGIGKDGRIGMYCEEKDRSWCTGGTIKVNGISGSMNDHRAVTIECASDTAHPYAINDKVYASLVKLCADICKRNGIKELKWNGDKSLVGQVDKQNMTVHRWFANKACPGDYIYNRLGNIANEVNAILKSGTTTTTTAKPEASSTYPKAPFLVRIKINNLNHRTGPGTNYQSLGFMPVGSFTVTEVSGDWGKLKSPSSGWVNLKYTEIVK